jgi:ADP-heptose:LPS heptosyltransferase
MVGSPTPAPPAWTAPAPWRQAALSQLAAIGCQPGQCGLAVLQPGAGSPLKCWPLERFLELAGELRRGGLTPLLVLGPTETEWWPGGLIESCRRRCSLVQDAPLPILAGLLAQARVFVGNDSGPGHLAAALGCNVVSLFGPGDPRQFAPRGKVRLLQANDLGQLDVSTVLQAVGELLD